MRRIRFSPDMIKAILHGGKKMTFRRTPRPCGVYIVENGSYPRHEHVDTGQRIFIFRTFWVECVDSAYAMAYYRDEGFVSPFAFIEKLKALYGDVPDTGFAHEFELIKSQAGLDYFIQLTKGGKP